MSKRAIPLISRFMKPRELVPFVNIAKVPTPYSGPKGCVSQKRRSDVTRRSYWFGNTKKFGAVGSHWWNL